MAGCHGGVDIAGTMGSPVSSPEACAPGDPSALPYPAQPVQAVRCHALASGEWEIFSLIGWRGTRFCSSLYLRKMPGQGTMYPTSTSLAIAAIPLEANGSYSTLAILWEHVSQQREPWEILMG